MKLGDVMRKERKVRGLSAQETASELAVEVDAYKNLEGGDSPAESWGPLLAAIAIELETPTSRLLAVSGRSADARAGQVGPLIKGHRERCSRSPEEMATALGIGVEDYQEIERGDSPIEEIGPLLLRFAETIDQPVFNLFYPCGLPFQELDDYP